MALHMEKSRSFLESLSESPPRLPYEPLLLPRLFAGLSDGSNLSLGTLAEMIGRSQGLATKILAVANSACYGLQSTVSSLDRALSILGLREVRSLVIMFSVSSAIDPKSLPRDFPGRELWEHQIRTGRIAMELAKTLPRQASEPFEPDVFYVAGLLHDLGKSFLASRSREAWGEIRAIQAQKNIGFVQAEDEYWGMDHGTIAALVLEHWSIPALLTSIISWHHHPRLATRHQEAAKVLYAANLLDHSELLPDGPLPSFVAELLPAAANFPDLPTTIYAARLGNASHLAGFLA